MIIQIWTRNDGSGLLDSEYRDGDIRRVRPDSEESMIGEQELKSWLVIKIPDPPNINALLPSDPRESPLVEEEYTIGKDNIPIIRRNRKHWIDWRPKFSQEEITIIEDATQTLGVVADRFTYKDISRKS